MKTWGGLVVILLGLSTSSFAGDEVKIPFSVKEECFKTEMGILGYDLSGCDDCYGEAGIYEGEFTVRSFKASTIDELNIIKDCAFKCVRT